MPPSTCWFCDDWYYARFCPLKKQKCNVSHRVGHKKIFVTQFLKKNAESPIQRKFVKNKTERRRKLTLFETLKEDYKSSRKYIVSVNDKPVRFQFDTASYSTLISQSPWKLLERSCMSRTDHRVRSTSGDQIHLTGELTCHLTFQATTFSGICYLAENSELNSIGLDWIEQLNLFEVSLKFVFNTFSLMSVSDSEKHFADELKNKFGDVFQEGIGCCKAILKLNEDSEPIFRPK